MQYLILIICKRIDNSENVFGDSFKDFTEKLK